MTPILVAIACSASILLVESTQICVRLTWISELVAFSVSHLHFQMDDGRVVAISANDIMHFAIVKKWLRAVFEIVSLCLYRFRNTSFNAVKMRLKMLLTFYSFTNAMFELSICWHIILYFNIFPLFCSRVSDCHCDCTEFHFYSKLGHNHYRNNSSNDEKRNTPKLVLKPYCYSLHSAVRPLLMLNNAVCIRI